MQRNYACPARALQRGAAAALCGNLNPTYDLLGTKEFSAMKLTRSVNHATVSTKSAAVS